MSGGRRHGFPYRLLGVAATGVVTALQNHPLAPFAAGTSRPSGLREEAGATLPVGVWVLKFAAALSGIAVRAFAPVRAVQYQKIVLIEW